MGTVPSATTSRGSATYFPRTQLPLVPALPTPLDPERPERAAAVRDQSKRKRSICLLDPPAASSRDDAPSQRSSLYRSLISSSQVDDPNNAEAATPERLRHPVPPIDALKQIIHSTMPSTRRRASFAADNGGGGGGGGGLAPDNDGVAPGSPSSSGGAWHNFLRARGLPSFDMTSSATYDPNGPPGSPSELRILSKELADQIRKGVSFTANVVGGAVGVSELRGVPDAPKTSRIALDLADAALHVKENQRRERLHRIRSPSYITAMEPGGLRFMSQRRRYTRYAADIEAPVSSSSTSHVPRRGHRGRKQPRSRRRTTARVSEQHQRLLVPTTTTSSPTTTTLSSASSTPRHADDTTATDVDSVQAPPDARDKRRCPISLMSSPRPPPVQLEKLTILSLNAGLLEYRLGGLTWYRNPPFTKRRLYHIARKAVCVIGRPCFLASLRDSGCDFVALQEVYEEWQADYLIESLRVTFPFVARRTSGGALSLHNGLMLLSRFPILRTAFHPFDSVTAIERIFGSKGMLEATVEIPTVGQVTFVNIHLASGAVDPESTSLEALRNEEIEEVLNVCQLAASRGEVPIIVGDLNAAPNLCPSNYRKLCETGWRDAFLVAARGEEDPRIEVAALDACWKDRRKFQSDKLWWRRRSYAGGDAKLTSCGKVGLARHVLQGKLRRPLHRFGHHHPHRRHHHRSVPPPRRWAASTRGQASPRHVYGRALRHAASAHASDPSTAADVATPPTGTVNEGDADPCIPTVTAAVATTSANQYDETPVVTTAGASENNGCLVPLASSSSCDVKKSAQKDGDVPGSRDRCRLSSRRDGGGGLRQQHHRLWQHPPRRSAGEESSTNDYYDEDDDASTDHQPVSFEDDGLISPKSGSPSSYNDDDDGQPLLTSPQSLSPLQKAADGGRLAASDVRLPISSSSLKEMQQAPLHFQRLPSLEKRPTRRKTHHRLSGKVAKLVKKASWALGCDIEEPTYLDMMGDEGDPFCTKHFTWDPKNPLNVIGPHAECHGLRCDHLFLPPKDIEGGLADFCPVQAEIVFTEPQVTVEGCCCGLLGQASLVTLSDHYGIRIQLKRTQ